MTATYAVFPRDSNRLLQAQIDDYDQLDLVLRFNQPGSWALQGVNRESAAAAYLAVGGGIVVERGGVSFFSGPLERYRRYRQTDDDGFVTDSLDVAGPDDLVHLWRRVAHPSPADVNFATAEEDVRTGAAETVIRGYVDVNAGSGAVSTRRVDGLTIAADGLLGSTLTERARLDILGELVAAVAVKGGGLGFRVVQDGVDLEFSVYGPADLSGSVELSDDVGNLGDFSYEITAPERNQVYVGGGGEGTARTFVERVDATAVSRWGRIESFRDRRDTTDTTELALTGDEEIEIAGERVSVEVGAVDLANLTFGVDYNLGDQITAVIDGVSIVQVIREVHITVTADSENVVPVLGTAGVVSSTDLLVDVFDRLRRVSNRITNLERR